MPFFTIGSTDSYDKALALARQDDRTVEKTGRDSDAADSDYPGGWVWQDIDEARAKAKALEEKLGYSFSVYELRLFGSWDQCVYLGEDGEHHLEKDAVVTRKVENR